MDPAPQPADRNRRTTRRRPPRSGVRLSLRAGSMGLGPDLALGLVDISDDGICVRVKAPLPVRSEAEVVFEKAGSGRPLKAMADVRWCVTDPDGTSRVGLQLRHRLLFSQLMDYTKN